MSFVTGLLIWVLLLLPHIEYLLRARKHHNELINARETPAQVKNIIETSKINMMYFVWKQVSHHLDRDRTWSTSMSSSQDQTDVLFLIHAYSLWQRKFYNEIPYLDYVLVENVWCVLCSVLFIQIPNQCKCPFKQLSFKPSTTVILYKRTHENCVVFLKTCDFIMYWLNVA